MPAPPFTSRSNAQITSDHMVLASSTRRSRKTIITNACKQVHTKLSAFMDKYIRTKYQAEVVPSMTRGTRERRPSRPRRSGDWAGNPYEASRRREIGEQHSARATVNPRRDGGVREKALTLEARQERMARMGQASIENYRRRMQSPAQPAGVDLTQPHADIECYRDKPLPPTPTSTPHRDDRVTNVARTTVTFDPEVELTAAIHRARFAEPQTEERQWLPPLDLGIPTLQPLDRELPERRCSFHANPEPGMWFSGRAAEVVNNPTSTVSAERRGSVLQRGIQRLRGATTNTGPGIGRARNSSDGTGTKDMPQKQAGKAGRKSSSVLDLIRHISRADAPSKNAAREDSGMSIIDHAPSGMMLACIRCGTIPDSVLLQGLCRDCRHEPRRKHY